MTGAPKGPKPGPKRTHCNFCGVLLDPDRPPYGTTRRGTPQFDAKCPDCIRRDARTRYHVTGQRVRKNQLRREKMAENPAMGLYIRARDRANHKGVPFTIELSEIVPLPTHCPVLGIPLNIQGRNGNSANSLSLDRIVNEKGYVPGNVLVCSRRANILKSDATPEELRKVAGFYTALEERSLS